MFLGKVIGSVWSTVKWPQLTGVKFLLVQPFEYGDLTGEGPVAGPQDGVVVADTLDAGVGDTVLVAFGHAARVAISPEIGQGEAPPIPIDAAVVAVVDGFEISTAS